MTAGTEPSTRWPIIPKAVGSFRVRPNLVDYDAACGAPGVLRSLGIGRGERVFSLTGRGPALYVAVLGTFKNASVFCPLFSAFGPEPVRQRLHLGSGRALVTTRALYRKKIAQLRDSLPELRHVLLTDADGRPEPGTLDLAALMHAAPADGEVAATQAEDMALLHFTSGTTGTPKGAIHVHDAVT